MVDGRSFIENLKDELRLKAKGRRVVLDNDSFTLRASHAPYGIGFEPEKGLLRLENLHEWNSSADKTVG